MRQFSIKQEKKIAKAVGGKVVSNSGATAFAKGDVNHPLILIDGKTSTTKKKSITVQEEWFKKITEEAFSMNKDFGVVAFDFGDDKIYYAVEEKHFIKLLKSYEKENT